MHIFVSFKVDELVTFIKNYIYNIAYLKINLIKFLIILLLSYLQSRFR